MDRAYRAKAQSELETGAASGATTLAMGQLYARGRVADLLAAVCALGVYAATMAPTITWRNQGADSGDLAASAFVLGVPHPPGYPLYTLLGALAVRFPFGNPAGNLAFLSAFFSGAAIFVFARAIRRGLGQVPDSRARRFIPSLVALALAFSPLFWSQSTIPEVYALNNLLVALLLMIAFSSGANRLLSAAAVIGIGLAHHLTILLFVPGLLVLFFPWRLTASKAISVGAAAVVPPLLLYLYLPLSARLDPPVNWGNPVTWDGLFWTLSAAPYRPYLFDISLADGIRRLADVAALLFQNFTFVGVAAGIWGLLRMFDANSGKRRLGFGLLISFLLVVGYAAVYNSKDSFVYLGPAFMLFAVWIAFGLIEIASLVPSRWRGAVIVIVALLPIASLIVNYGAMDLSKDREAISYADGVFRAVPDRSVLVSDGDEHFFALEYYRYVVQRNSDVLVVSSGLVQFDWYYEQVMRKLGASVDGAGAVPPGWQGRISAIAWAGQANGRRIFSTTNDVMAGVPTFQVGQGLYEIRLRY